MLLVSQAVGLVVIGGFAALRGEGPPAPSFVLAATLGGLAGTVAIASFYRGLAVGAMGVVAPISATAAAIPIAVGVASGERPSSLQAAGIALAVVGVAAASREAPAASGGGRIAGGVGLALASALGFGASFVFLDEASAGDPTWAVLTGRLAGIAALAAVALRVRPRFRPGRGDLPALVAIGIFDVGGQTLFAVATTQGLLSVVAVLASLYPVTTVLLARVFLGERIRAAQRAGTVVALGGVALIAGG